MVGERRRPAEAGVVIRIRKLQVARRAVQWTVVLLMLAVPMLARYVNYLSARELDKALDRWEGGPQGTALYAIDRVLRALPEGEVERAGRPVRHRAQVMEYAQALRGGPWSAQAGPVSMTDPLAGAEMVVASKGASRVLWIGLAIPVVLALLLGRVFCSWICPMGLLTELSDKLRRVLRWLELKPHNIRPARATKFVLLGVGLVVAAWTAAPVLGYVYPPAILNRELHDLVFGFFDRAEMGRFGFWAGGLTWMSLVIAAIVVIELTVSRRWWCRYVCPGGALYCLLGAVRPLRVYRRESACTLCGACNQACHLGLKPMQERVMGIECDNCGQCISHCSDDALGVGIRLRAKGEA